jgi:hypothetical protein
MLILELVRRSFTQYTYWCSSAPNHEFEAIFEADRFGEDAITQCCPMLQTSCVAPLVVSFMVAAHSIKKERII